MRGGRYVSVFAGLIDSLRYTQCHPRPSPRLHDMTAVLNGAEQSRAEQADRRAALEATVDESNRIISRQQQHQQFRRTTTVPVDKSQHHFTAEEIKRHPHKVSISVCLSVCFTRGTQLTAAFLRVRGIRWTLLGLPPPPPPPAAASVTSALPISVAVRTAVCAWCTRSRQECGPRRRAHTDTQTHGKTGRRVVWCACDLVCTHDRDKSRPRQYTHAAWMVGSTSKSVRARYPLGYK